MSADWNAEQYHVISEPQFRWGLEVLDSLELKGDETVIDAGCGTGRLTAVLMDRLPRGHVIALDGSDAMLGVARRELEKYDLKVGFIRADLGDLELERVADVIFSTATFHWVLNHAALFRGLHAALKPGGRLHAQCGGFGNLERHLRIANEVAGRGPWAKRLENLDYPTHFATPEESLQHMKAAGFARSEAWLKLAPTPFDDARAFRTFIKHVPLRPQVAAAGDLADAYLDAVVQASAPDYSLDYVRLELRATAAA
jgi:trans-aconitate 2-methyltransferase